MMAKLIDLGKISRLGVLAFGKGYRYNLKKYLYFLSSFLLI